MVKTDIFTQFPVFLTWLVLPYCWLQPAGWAPCWQGWWWQSHWQHAQSGTKKGALPSEWPPPPWGSGWCRCAPTLVHQSCWLGVIWPAVSRVTTQFHIDRYDPGDIVQCQAGTGWCHKKGKFFQDDRQKICLIQIKRMSNLLSSQGDDL